MIEIGDKVRVANTADMCCGVLMQNNKGVVVEIIDVVMEDERQTAIVILDDLSLHWLEDLEKEECSH